MHINDYSKSIITTYTSIMVFVNMTKVDSLNTFVSVVAEKNFTIAAEQLGLTPSAVSKQISALEERLGVRLLNRTTRSVSPTEAGSLFYERCKRILVDIFEAEQQICDLDTHARGTLKITAASNFGRNELATMFAAFNQQYPDVNIELTISDKHLDIVKEGYDFALRLGSQEDSALIARQIARHAVILCASPSYLESFGTPTQFTELDKHRILWVSTQEYTRASWLKNMEKIYGLNLDNSLNKFTANEIHLV
jgi:DNA-binding transcriptional LysR family regulator